MVLGLGLRFRVWGFQALGLLLLHELTHLGLQLGALPLIDYEVSWHSLLKEGLVAQVNVVAVVVVVVVLAGVSSLAVAEAVAATARVLL